MIDYRYLTCEELGKLEGFEEYGDYYEAEFRETLVRFEDNKATEVVFIDGGEPEDMTLGRDLGAFVTELNWLAKKLNNRS